MSLDTMLAAAHVDTWGTMLDNHASLLLPLMLALDRMLDNHSSLLLALTLALDTMPAAAHVGTWGTMALDSMMLPFTFT